MAPVVTASGLEKRFDGVTALSDVTVSIESGEIFALIGPNGAGKTTFVRAITGTIVPTDGSVSVFGGNPGTIDFRRLGLLPQAFSPPERLTGREIVRYYAGLYDRSRDVESVLQDVGMDEDADRWYERLSGGQQRRICVATALVNDPELLILDEPTTGIDPGGRRQLWGLFRELQAAGRTLLLTTHDMAEAATLGDRVGLIDEGRLIEVGSTGHLIERHGGQGRVVLDVNQPPSIPLDRRLDRPITETDGHVIIGEVEPTELRTVIEVIEDSGLQYHRLTWEEPTLEDVFFALTEAEGSS